MSNIFAASLMIIGPVGTLVFAAAVLGGIGLMAWDLIAGRSTSATKPVRVLSQRDAEDSISLKRGVARAFVILGGAFWGATAFAGLYWFSQTGMREALLAAAVPLVGTVVTLLVGWYWERVASVLLFAASAVAVYWGIASQFEPGVWALVIIAMVGPMLTASALFWFARREQEALELSLAAHPELRLVTIDR